ncbi:hypothetical protein HK096_001234 [Nowakowskiella sp. JEL0078]|nr:hypothetical protein HK096_001234 [Nowakowskiella sp. JEL0078]
MARTSVNLTGNMLACYIVAKWEGRFREPGWDSIPVSSESKEVGDEVVEVVEVSKEADEVKVTAV